MKILNIFKDVLKVILPICNEYHHTAKWKNCNHEYGKNERKRKEKKEPLRNSYELDLLTIFFRIGLDFFSDSAIIRIQNPYMQAAARWRGREVCEKMKNKSMSILKMTGAAAALVLMFAQPVLADGSFANGTSVNGVAVGGMSNEEAKAKLEQNYGSYKLTIKERGGKTEEITAAEIGYKVVITNELQAAIDQQAAGAAGAGALTIAMPLSCDQTMLANRIASLNCMSDSAAPTVDAHISAWEEGKDFTIVPEVKGESVDKAKVQTAINAAIASGMTEIDLEALGCYTPIQVTSGDASLKALCAQMNQAKNAVITFHIGDATETLSGTEYVSWYTGGENGVITVDRDKAAAYIKALAAKYDTAGTTRTFHTTSGKEVALTGPYG